MNVRKAGKSKWQTFVNNCPSATFFHTPTWHEVWQKYRDFQPKALVIEFSEGRSCLFPFSEKKHLKGFAKESISSPAGTYGGPVSNFDLLKNEFDQLENYLKSNSFLRMRANPFQHLIQDAFWTDDDFTQLVDLRHDLKFLHKKWTKGHFAAAKKGIREGIRISTAKTREDWQAYYEVYLNSVERWGKTARTIYGWKLFEIIKNHCRDMATLWIARYEDEIISGALCFYFNNKVHFWNGATVQQYFDLKPAHVLQYQIITDAHQKGYEFYDFGPSGGLPGVIKFKKGFGAEKVPSGKYVKHSAIVNEIKQIATRWKS